MTCACIATCRQRVVLDGARFLAAPRLFACDADDITARVVCGREFGSPVLDVFSGFVHLHTLRVWSERGVCSFSALREISV